MSNDSGSFGWAVLGFFVPLAGLILWLVWKDDKPKSAKMCGVGALVSVIADVVLTLAALMLFPVLLAPFLMLA